MHISQGFTRETESAGDIYIYIYNKIFIVGSWLVQPWMLSRQLQSLQGRPSGRVDWELSDGNGPSHPQAKLLIAQKILVLILRSFN